jgi:hypothetical protein
VLPSIYEISVGALWWVFEPAEGQLPIKLIWSGVEVLAQARAEYVVPIDRVVRYKKDVSRTQKYQNLCQLLCGAIQKVPLKVEEVVGSCSYVC